MAAAVLPVKQRKPKGVVPVSLGVRDGNRSGVGVSLHRLLVLALDGNFFLMVLDGSWRLFTVVMRILDI